MSLDKAIKYGKEKRKAYTGAKQYDTSCRNHGGCPYCESNRMFNTRRQELNAKEKLRDYYCTVGK